MIPQSQPPRTWRRIVALALLFATALGCFGIREDEFVCEDAVSHLRDCCPGFTGNGVDCRYEAGSCGQNSIYPEISVSQSECIRSKSCDALRTSGVCARALAMPPGETWEYDESQSPSGTSASFPQVCP